MSRKILLSLSLFLFLALAQAQELKRFSPEEFRNHLESYIMREACLTPSDAKSFFPLFHELKNKQREIHEKVATLKRKKLSPNADDKEYADILFEINELKIEAAKLDETYYKKMCKVISAQKVHSAILAEDHFHREMLRRFSRKNIKR